MTPSRKRMAIWALLCSLSLLLGGCKEKPTIIPPTSVSIEIKAVPVVSSQVDSIPEEPDTHGVDFAALQRENPDIVGWIQIPGTVIDDPILTGRDNAYYLTHDPQRQYYIGGSVFIDMSNEDDFSDPVMVAYGHYMPDESLFTQLHKYKDKTFMQENQRMVIDLPAETREYQIVAAFRIGEQNILYNRDYTKPRDMEYFVNWLKQPPDAQAVLQLEGTTVQDQFLVLSTCLSLTDNSGRFIVVARLAEQIPRSGGDPLG